MRTFSQPVHHTHRPQPEPLTFDSIHNDMLPIIHKLICQPPRSIYAQAATVCIAISLSTGSLSQGALPALGDTSEMAAGVERRLGDRIARELYRDPDYIDDPVLVEYVQSIWQPLLAAARARGDLSAELQERFAFEVFLGKDRSINAFALPGGYFGLHLGLVAVVTSKDELASVMAHELSHVTQRHISRLITQDKRQAPWLIGAMILGALAASKNPEMANAVIAGGQAVAAQGQLNFSRDMEREADRVGFAVLAQAGFDPQGFVGMFDKLQQAARLNDTGAFPYLRSHPLTSQRLADMQVRQPLEGRALAPAKTAEQAMLTARAQVLSNAAVDAQRARLVQAQQPGASAAALYAAALAGMRLRDFGAANRYAEQLQKAVVTEPAALRLATLLQAEIALAQALPQRALQLLPDPGTPITRPQLLLYAQASVMTGRQSEAAQALQTWVADHPRDAGAWQLLAAAHTAAGRSQRALRAEAQAHMATLDYAAANDRLKAAQELGRRLLREQPQQHDHIEASIIDTQARQVALLLREQALER
jgi:predicted Zn-dependent protease